MKALVQHIAVIEDSLQMRTLLQDFLTNEGYLVSSFGSAIETLNAFKKDGTSFDVVVSDIAMPGINGMELLKQLRQQRPTLAFILITAFGTAEGAEEANRLGAVDYLVKPFKLGHLGAVIKRSLVEQSRLAT